jgi:flagellar motor switch protein FliG
MDKIRNAAIIIIGMGDRCAAEILKNMHPKEVQKIMDVITTIDDVSEEEVVKALNEFFKESNGNAGFDLASKEHLKSTLASVLGLQGMDSVDGGTAAWLELLKEEPAANIAELIHEEHPQVITALILIISHLNNEQASDIIKNLEKPLQNKIIKKMTTIGPISAFALEAFSNYFEKELDKTERYTVISVDGIDAAANIISNLDSESERDIINDISSTDKPLAEKIQDKILPFERLAHLDNKSLQILLNEVTSDDLVLSLKGVDEYVKNIIMKNMSTKAAEILQDEIETKGPVKLKNVIEAQKRIIGIAKKLNQEEKIFITTKNDPDDVIL